MEARGLHPLGHGATGSAPRGHGVQGGEDCGCQVGRVTWWQPEVMVEGSQELVLR